MLTSRIGLKLYATTPVSAHALLEVFHRWIKERHLGEQLIDVVDYGHVHHGPAVLMVGHESDYALDLGEGRAGLFYQRKRAPEVAEGPLVDGLRRLLRAADDLTKEPTLAPLAFDRRELCVTFLDRLHAPNTPAAFEAVTGAIRDAVRPAFGEVKLVHEAPTSREPLTVRVTST
jgi:hypothetical protein